MSFFASHVHGSSSSRNSRNIMVLNHQFLLASVMLAQTDMMWPAGRTTLGKMRHLFAVSPACRLHVGDGSIS